MFPSLHFLILCNFDTLKNIPKLFGKNPNHGETKMEMKGAFTLEQRRINAAKKFTSNVMEQFDYTQEQALAILDVFIKLKAVKMDYGIGIYQLVHGRYWEKDVMDRALNY